jgi:hypothetical protein
MLLDSRRTLHAVNTSDTIVFLLLCYIFCNNAKVVFFPLDSRLAHFFAAIEVVDEGSVVALAST